MSVRCPSQYDQSSPAALVAFSFRKSFSRLPDALQQRDEVSMQYMNSDSSESARTEYVVPRSMPMTAI